MKISMVAVNTFNEKTYASQKWLNIYTTSMGLHLKGWICLLLGTIYFFKKRLYDANDDYRVKRVAYLSV